jgi:hypothetical protein
MSARLDAAGRHARLGVVHVVDDALAVLEKRRALERQRDTRVVRTNSFTPRRSSSASMRRPMIAGATPSRARPPKTALRGDDREGFDLLESIHLGKREPDCAAQMAAKKRMIVRLGG